MSEEKVVKSICWWCKGRCGVLVYRDGNLRFVEMDQDPEYPQQVDFSIKKGCVRLKNAKEWIDHPDRLSFPLKRKGERGEGKWERISWDQALDEIAEKLKAIKDTFGPEAVIATCGDTWTHDEYKSRFFNLFGTPWNHIGPNPICYGPRSLVNEAILGWYPNFSMVPGVTRCVVVLGAEHFVSRPTTYKITKACKNQGAKLIVFNPRKTHTGSIADLLLQPRPGTDGAVLLAWINYIIHRRLYDEGFVRKWTNAPLLVRTDKGKLLRESDLYEGGGKEKFVIWDEEREEPRVYDISSIRFPSERPSIDKSGTMQLKDGKKADFKTVWALLREKVAPYTIEKASEISWLPAQKIEEAARLYAENRPGVILEGAGVEISTNSAQIIHMKGILAALTGNIGVKGGEELPGPYLHYISDREIELSDRLSEKELEKQVGSKKFRFISWPGQKLIDANMKRVWGKRTIAGWYTSQAHQPAVLRTILTGDPYPIRAMISSASGPILANANTKLTYKAMKSLDLYVVLDLFMGPHAALADYVLPSTSWLERPAVYAFGFLKSISAAPAALPASIEGEFDRRSDFDFWRGLGVRLGQEEYWPWKSLEEAYDYRLKPLGITFEEFAHKKRIIMDVSPEYEQYKKKGFATSTGKVELYSAIFEELGYDPLPYFKEPPESPVSNPELAKDYPFVFISGGRYRPFFGSDFFQVDSIRRTHPDPVVQIHPEAAQQIGISDGDWVWIETPRGRIMQKCSFFEGINPGVVHGQMWFWYPEFPGEEPWLHGAWISNLNVLTDDEPDLCNEITGSWPARQLMCKIYKVKTFGKEGSRAAEELKSGVSRKIVQTGEKAK